MNNRFRIYCFVPALIYLAGAVLFTMREEYLLMAISVLGTLLGPSYFFYDWDQRRRNPERPEVSEKQIMNLASLVILPAFLLAWVMEIYLAATVLMVLAFLPQFYSKEHTAQRYMFNGMFAGAAAIWGLQFYTAAAAFFVPISIYFAFTFFAQQRAENQERRKQEKREANQAAGKTKRKKKKKK